MYGVVNGVSDEQIATDLLIKTGKTNETGRLSPMYFCAARLEKDQTKRGSDALHPFPHSNSLRGNRWRDASRLRHCSVDAEHLVTSRIFGGSTGRLTTTLAHELAI